MLKITKIRLTFRGQIPAGFSAKAENILSVYATQCPAYQSVKGCIDVTWTSELVEAD